MGGCEIGFRNLSDAVRERTAPQVDGFGLGRRTVTPTGPAVRLLWSIRLSPSGK